MIFFYLFQQIVKVDQGADLKGAKKMKYVISDVHGKLERLKSMLVEIDFGGNDVLYILGDLVDRGPQSIETIEFVMNHPQIQVLRGNHDEMMVQYLKYKNEVEKERWFRNSCESTLEVFEKRSKEEQEAILDYLDSLPYYKIVEDKYFLVHAGVNMKRLKKDLHNLAFEEALLNQKDRLIWIREEFFKEKAFDEYITVFGHSPIAYIDKIYGTGTDYEEENMCRPIWFDSVHNDKIGIDTGNAYDHSHMACLCLDNMKVYYVI